MRRIPRGGPASASGRDRLSTMSASSASPAAAAPPATNRPTRPSRGAAVATVTNAAVTATMSHGGTSSAAARRMPRPTMTNGEEVRVRRSSSTHDKRAAAAHRPKAAASQGGESVRPNSGLTPTATPIDAATARLRVRRNTSSTNTASPAIMAIAYRTSKTAPMRKSGPSRTAAIDMTSSRPGQALGPASSRNRPRITITAGPTSHGSTRRPTAITRAELNDDIPFGNHMLVPVLRDSSHNSRGVHWRSLPLAVLRSGARKLGIAAALVVLRTLIYLLFEQVAFVDADIGDLRGFLDIVVSVAALLERFPAKWIPVRVKKTRQNK